LHAAAVVRPDWPSWQAELGRAIDQGAHAIRAYPTHWGLGPDSSALNELAVACAERKLPLVLTVRFEDGRQRHRLDVAGDLPAATVRGVARAGTGARIVVTAAGRSFIEETHWGLTPAERSLVWYDTSWIWGPPEDDFAHLMRAIGPERFVYGTGWPLRLAQVTRANLALLPSELAGLQLVDPSGWKRGI
jgi:predicted TIM-barrel fold metal-dependent hydrolase